MAHQYRQHQEPDDEAQNGYSDRSLGAPGKKRYPMQRLESKVSTLSIEQSDAPDSSDDEFLDAVDDHTHEEEGRRHGFNTRTGDRGSNSEVVCRHCSSNSFQAARSKDGKTRLVCTTCGTPT